jgi:2-methylisocitrate lyase-like PEP mutase family enzyme
VSGRRERGAIATTPKALRYPGFTVQELGDAGVRRVSLGSAFSRAALSTFLLAAREVRDKGSFSFLEDLVRADDLAAFMAGPTGHS